MKKTKLIYANLLSVVFLCCMLAMLGTACAEESPAQSVVQDPTSLVVAATVEEQQPASSDLVDATLSKTEGETNVTTLQAAVSEQSAQSEEAQETASSQLTSQASSVSTEAMAQAEEANTVMTTASTDETLLQAAAEETADMYRLYNPNSGEHFYTGSKAERLNLVQLGWNYEGIGWVAPVSSSSPVYRLYNPYAGDHHYTLNAAERDYLVNVGWDDEGIGWYSDDSQRVALLRQYNPYAEAGTHNFTTSQDENDNLVSLGWNAEGIGWYAIDYGKQSSDFSYIYLDAGHGWGSGTSGVYDSGASGNGYVEARETVELVNLIAQYARDDYGLAIYTNCGTGVHYSDRQMDALNHSCTSLVSIHFNASDSGGTGTESYIHESNPAAGASRLQSIMHESLVDSLGLADRGMKSHNWAVCSGAETGIPAVLLEICFIDNSYDMRVYKSKEDAVAHALAAALYEASQMGF